MNQALKTALLNLLFSFISSCFLQGKLIIILSTDQTGNIDKAVTIRPIFAPNTVNWLVQT